MATNGDIPQLQPQSPSLYRTIQVPTPKSAPSRSVHRFSESPIKQRTLSRLSLSPRKQNLSPLKRRPVSSPSKSPISSPRKSPAKSAFSQVKNVSFTPQRVRQPPRAWERRPATPFIPRDDKQKIWKRVPLGELGVDVNRPIGISRKDKEGSKDYTRIVKKLKLGHGISDHDQENSICAVGSKIVGEEADLKRPQKQTFVTMRVEDDEIRDSPKKKLRQNHDEDQGHKAALTDISHIESAELDEHGVDLSSCSSDVETDECETDDMPVAAETHNVVDSQSLQDEEVSEQQSSLPFQVDADASFFTDSVLQLESEIAVEEEEDEMQEGGEGDAQSLKQESPTPPHFDEAEHGDYGQSTLEAANIFRGSLHGADAPDATTPIERAADQVVYQQEGSSSPPTILTENITVDELAARDSPKASQPNTKDDHPNQGSSVTPEVEEQQMQFKEDTAPRRISDDETAFLREFMSRTKAQRAAREQAMQEVVDEVSNVTTTKQLATSEDADALDQQLVSPPRLEPETEESGASSPLRRSKRAAVTSIPRPHVNSIQLKRANGSEFIFTANKAQSAANVALMTRSNTKKNKGSAMNVSARLEQILVERANEEKLENAQTNGETKMDEKSQRKRKGAKADGNSRAKKVLRWNDEKLVSYQEAEKISDDLQDEIEDSSQENVKYTGDEEPGTYVKLTLTMNSDSQDQTGPNRVERKKTDSTSQSKVRKVRRGISGAVNGTPAPKTRSKRIIDDDFDAVDVTLEVSTANEITTTLADSSAISAEDVNLKSASTGPTNGRKSRMPVPATKRGAAASASIRTAAVSSHSHRVPSGTSGVAAESRESSSQPMKESRGRGIEQLPKQKEADKENGDLLGRRRLRVRS